ncbi:MAG TPA: type II toxin-antitoxin system VapC family toxin [Chloroflexota bacterium]|nr:type II toxin-antitoxin system VapC family toxin [Chloroflexota bacterium]
MILVDTSVWVDHLRAGNQDLAARLDAGQVLAHSFVLGELALAPLRQREPLLALLADLPQAVVATEPEVLAFITSHALPGQGIGYVDAHLLAATSLTQDATLWTQDKRLQAIAVRLGLAAAA